MACCLRTTYRGFILPFGIQIPNAVPHDTSCENEKPYKPGCRKTEYRSPDKYLERKYRTAYRVTRKPKTVYRTTIIEKKRNRTVFARFKYRYRGHPWEYPCSLPTSPSLNRSNGGSANAASGSARAATPPAKPPRNCSLDSGNPWSILQRKRKIVRVYPEPCQVRYKKTELGKDRPSKT